MKINRHYLDLKESYLFSTISKKVSDYKAEHPKADIIQLGIGDVTLPLPQVCVDAMKKAADEQSHAETFRGYGPEQGYAFLRDAIVGYYGEKGIALSANEVFVSDGAKSDLGNILDIFSEDNTVLIPDPVYPVYVDTNVMAGRRILYMDACAENGFLPMPNPAVKADIIYLCSPNNPTGAVYTKEQLAAWIAYALDNSAVILYDAAYEAFVSDPSLPRSIYEVENANRCAIEFCSFSKTAGFTGTRCGWTVVPDALMMDGVRFNQLWLRRQTTKFNGVSYVVQRGAAAIFSEEGQRQIRANIDVYRENARVIAQTLAECGVWFTGGENSPYIWFECPNGMDSWDFFDMLLHEANVVGTPGTGFGENGKTFFRLTSFGSPDATKEAMKRVRAFLKK
ncbi:MAG: LL-diaminopimelate aminotransferase [Oscillospiraceae bacterium]|nr:LL-diaminopimelate aminotransferase [Oscillospiraceae bacterium]MDY3066093.1 LL-diaminopimelate aminotransferase [Oscillospiraceae bacterium]